MYDIEMWTRGDELIIKKNKDLPLLDRLPFLAKDKVYHSKPIYFDKLAKLFSHKLYFDEDPIWKAELQTDLKIKPRPYQKKAHDEWMQNKRGYIVLPTGTGKTIQALMAIDELKVSTLVVVPTIDLLEQWKDSIEKNLGVEAGMLGGGSTEIKPVTITTYDSARIYSSKLNKFRLVIFDEVHHLPAAQNRKIAESLLAPYRMGLTATPERSDQGHEDLYFLVGDEIFRRDHSELKDYLADFRIERIRVGMSEKEKVAYHANYRRYKNYIRKRKLYHFGKDVYKQLIFRANRDKEARSALMSHQRARKIALNAEKKITKVLELLIRHKEDKVIIFSEFNSIVDEISMKYLIPSITHKTKTGERRKILDNFKSGKFTKIVTGKVLDEGVDVPDASVGIIVSGTSSKRSYIQRLGRIIRPKEKEAVLYELLTARTMEMKTSKRRKL